MSKSKHTGPATALYVVIFAILVPLVHAALGLAFDAVLGNPLASIRPLWLPSLLGSPFILGGALMALLASIELKRTGGGYPVSSLSPRVLVTKGVYAFSRHPVYLGFSILYLGASLAIGSFWNCILSWPLFVLFFFSYGKGIEEPALVAKYGDAYDAYRKRTPFFFRLRPGRYFGKISLRLVAPLWTLLSRAVNRPLILRGRKSILFVTYGVCCALGAGLGLLFSNLVLLSLGYSAVDYAVFLPVSLFSIVFFSHICWIVGTMVNERRPLSQVIGRIGFVSWGGIAGAFAAAPVVAAATKMAYADIVDALALCLIVVHTLGRIGCLVYGCCYGRETDSPLHLSYTHECAKVVREKRVNPSSVYPVQFFSALYGVVIFLLVFTAWLALPLPRFFPLAAVISLLALFRLNEEWFRFQKKVLWGKLAPAQLAAFGLLAAGGLFFCLALLGAGGAPYPALAAVDPFGRLSAVSFPLLMLAMGVVFIAFGFHRKKIGYFKAER